jgi:hypothetical protein
MERGIGEARTKWILLLNRQKREEGLRETQSAAH